VKPVEVPKTTFVQPREIPKELKKVDLTAIPDPKATEEPDPTPESNGGGAVENGVAGGVTGGVVGGVQGGTVGGEIGGVMGGQVGGVQGGVLGGVVGGKVGGTGTGTEGDGTGGKEAPVAAPAPEAGPMRVGGDVKAPVVTRRVQPEYPEIARKSRVAGVVIVEAIIDKHGNVDQVRVLKGLPMGLSAEAEAAVRQWKFRPGTLNGEPVDVIFSLTVNFSLGGDAVAKE
jgi:protein TonB